MDKIKNYYIKKILRTQDAVFINYLNCDYIEINSKDEVTALVIINNTNDLKKLNELIGAVYYILVDLKITLTPELSEKFKKNNINILGSGTHFKQCLHCGNYLLQVDKELYKQVTNEVIKCLGSANYLPQLPPELMPTFSFILDAYVNKNKYKTL